MLECGIRDMEWKLYKFLAHRLKVYALHAKYVCVCVGDSLNNVMGNISYVISTPCAIYIVRLPSALYIYRHWGYFGLVFYKFSNYAILVQNSKCLVCVCEKMWSVLKPKSIMIRIQL